MAGTSKLKIVNTFDDDTTRDLELGPFDSDTFNVETLRANIKNFDNAAIKQFYLSETGASFTSITAATLTQIEETDINLKVTD